MSDSVSDSLSDLLSHSVAIVTAFILTGCLCLQGALAAVAEVERGHQDIVDSVQCLAYSLGEGGIAEAEARGRLEEAVARIREPARVVFSDQVCSSYRVNSYSYLHG